MRLTQIRERVAQIKVELGNEKLSLEEVNSFEKEYNTLEEEKRTIEKTVETRKALEQRIVNLPEENVVKTFEKKTEERKEDHAKEYRTAFLKSLLGEEMNEVEKRAFVATTDNTSAVMPAELQNKIYSTMEEAHPILKDVQVLRTGAVISIAKHTAIVAGDAAIVAEGVANVDEENTFVNVTLSGKDFSKHVDFSYRLGKMAIPAFEQYLVKEISDRIGAAMAKDIITQIKADLAVGNKFAAALPGTLAMADILKALGTLKATGKVNVYVNGATLYGNIASMTGAEGKLAFIPNYQEAIAAQLLGKSVKEEDALVAGEVLFLDPNQFIYNVVQDIMLERDKDIKKHVHTISGFAIAEGTMTNDRAGAVVTVGTAV